ncbi:MAG: NADH-quinone oxidoreductase subunit N [Bacteroidetes bacterium]|nr:NADH-quinone oxidoreductase subunit N [Bacteroidota bacterium]
MNAMILSALWGVVMMFTGLATPSARMHGRLAILGMTLLTGAAWLDFIGFSLLSDSTAGGMLLFGTYESLFILLMSGCALLYLLLSVEPMSEGGSPISDPLALHFFVMTGICIVAGYRSLLMLFLGVEILSIPLYILSASDKKNLRSNEASLKYFLMGAFSTGLMLMGIALIYGTRGSFHLDALNIGLEALSPLMTAGIVLLMVSMAFKVSAAPFHFWTPDVYDGTPTVYTSFMATIVKGAAFFAFFRLFQDGLGRLHEHWRLLMAFLTAATLIIGNGTAVFQQSVKRMLAYSSIAQAGFMMLALFAMNQTARTGIVFYAVAYSLSTIGVFAVLARMKDHSFEAFNGLAGQKPLLALLITVFLLSLAGIPLTGGFFAKYQMIAATFLEGKMIWMAVLALLCAVLGVYYYFRIIQAMYFRSGSSMPPAISADLQAVLVVTALLVVALGIHPDWLLGMLSY